MTDQRTIHLPGLAGQATKGSTQSCFMLSDPPAAGKLLECARTIQWFSGIRGMPNAATELQFDIFPGYGDVVKRQSWIPLTFEIYHEMDGFSESSKSTRLADRSSTPYLSSCLKGLAKNSNSLFHEGNSFTWDIRLYHDRGTFLPNEVSFKTWKSARMALSWDRSANPLPDSRNCPIRPRLTTAPSCQRLGGSWLKTCHTMPLPMRVWTPLSACITKHEAGIKPVAGST